MNSRNDFHPTLLLAPMAGITDQVFRRLCFENGCGGATTEMVSAQGYLTAPPDRNAYRFLLARFPEEGPLSAQLFGADPLYMARAAEKLTETGLFEAVDLNMGCPAQKVVGGQSGSALMKDPPLAARIVSEVKRATVLPVTVKMRLGWDEKNINAAPFAERLEQAGADGFTVHGRTRMQQYAGRADWQAIAKVKQAVRVPVVANGDIFDGESARQALQITGCDGLAVGRGALGKPWVFAEIRAALTGAPYAPPPFGWIIETALRQAREMAAWKGEKSALLEMRKHFAWYTCGRRGAAQARTRINLAGSFAEVEALLRALEDEAN